jgi:hypothetical protein
VSIKSILWALLLSLLPVGAGCCTVPSAEEIACAELEATALSHGVVWTDERYEACVEFYGVTLPHGTFPYTPPEENDDSP